MKQKSNNFKSFVSLTGFSIFEKIIAFVYQAVIAAYLGAGLATDCYNAASQLFDLIDTTVLGAIIVAVIHRFTDISKNKDDESAFAFLSNVSSSLTIVMLSISVLVFIFARSLSYVIAPGFEEAGRGGLVLCIRILCLLPPLMVMASVRQALLRQKKCFIAVNSRSLCISVCGLITVIYFSKLYPDQASILCVGYLVSNFVFVAILHICGRKFGRIYYAKPKFDNELKTLLWLAVPTIVSKGIVRLSLLVDQIIASTCGTGSISYLNYAQSLYHIVSNLLIVNLCMILLTDFTNLAVKHETEKMKEKLKSSVSSILLLLAPITLLTICFSREIVAIAYQRRAFGAESTKQVAMLLLLYAVGFIPSLMNSIYTQVLYSFGKTKIAMYNTLIALGSNLVLSSLLSYFIGLPGIALATTIALTIAFFAYRVSIKKCLPDYKSSISAKYVLKVGAGLLACGGVIIAVKYFIHTALLSFGIATIGSFAIFFAVLLLLKEENIINYYRVVISKTLRTKH